MRRVVVLLVLLAVLGAVEVSSSVGSQAGAQPYVTYSDTDPAWSPNGRFIAFTRLKELRFRSVYIVAVETGEQRRLVTGGLPSWSPDGARIAFEGDKGGIFTIKVDGTGLTRLTTKEDSYPVWSPDGRTIAFERYEPTGSPYALYVIPASGGKARPVCTGRRLDCLRADWSPDGTKIAFDASLANGVERILVAGRDGRNVRELAEGYGPDWSPDGQEIAFSTGRDDPVRLMRSDGSNVRALRKGMWPRFSPDGKRIAFYRGGGLRVMDRDGSHFSRLTRPGFNYDEDHSWSPDGRLLVFARRRCCDQDTPDQVRVWVVKSDGSQSRQLSH